MLETIIAQLQPTPPSRTLLSAHVAFLVGTFCTAHPELQDTVQHHALFPFLLASKAKFRSARGVWEAIKGSGGFLSGWLKGCVEVWDKASLLRKGASDKEKEDAEEDIEKVCEVNLGVASMIAGGRSHQYSIELVTSSDGTLENILASDDPEGHIALLLSKLQDPMPHGRALAYLVCRKLLAYESGDRKIILATQVLRAMRLRMLNGADDVLAGSNLQEVQRSSLRYLSTVLLLTTYPQAFGEHQVTMKATIKPGGRSTTHFMQASTLALILGVSAPQNFSGNWMTVLSHVCVPICTYLVLVYCIPGAVF